MLCSGTDTLPWSMFDRTNGAVALPAKCEDNSAALLRFSVYLPHHHLHRLWGETQTQASLQAGPCTSPHVQTDLCSRHQAPPWVTCLRSGSPRRGRFGDQLLTPFIQINSCGLSGMRSYVRYECEIPVFGKFLPFLGCGLGTSPPYFSPSFKVFLT